MKKDILSLALISAFTESTKIIKQVEVKKQKNYLASFKLQKGHTLFEINTKTGFIYYAEYQDKDVIIGKDNTLSKRKSVIVKEDCIYIGALNVENVKKKLRKQIAEFEKVV